MNSAIVIFAYNRIDTLKEVWESIDIADSGYERNCYVFIDGQSTSDNSITLEIQELCEVYKPLFNSFELFVREKNFGLKMNIELGLDYVFLKEKYAIILEDDILLAKCAFSYIDNMVGHLEGQDIACISLYQYPVKVPEDSSYLSTMFACWGWATSSEHWLTYRKSEKDSRLPLTSFKEFNVGLYGTYIEQLIGNRFGVTSTWFVHWYLYNFLVGNRCLYPGKSLAANIGFNSDGTNCFVSTSEYDVPLGENYSMNIRPLNNDVYKNLFKGLRINRFGYISVIYRYIRILFKWV